MILKESWADPEHENGCGPTWESTLLTKLALER